MYTVLIIVLLLGAAGLFWRGIKQKRTGSIVLGGLVVAATIGFFSFLGFWGEMLWFDAVGYGRRFWTVIQWQVTLGLGGAALAALLVHLLTRGLDRSRRALRIGSKLVAAYAGGHWGVAHWDTVLLYLNRVTTGIEEPILGRETGFYLFTLPLYEAVFTFLILIAIIALVVWGIALFLRIGDERIELRLQREGDEERTGGYPAGFYWSAAAFLAVLAYGAYLDRFQLLYSTLGVVAGPGWTDVHARLPAYWVMIVLLLGVVVLLAVPSARRFITRLAGRLGLSPPLVRLSPLAAAAAVPLVAWFLLLLVLPGLLQWLYVEPNEITVERPYISHNIEFTRRAFKLHEAEEREFPVSETFAQSMVAQNRGTFDNVRLWDWRALTSVYEQFQEIRLYYEFHDVDVDRYRFGDEYRQVMVSAREMEPTNLPPQSQTFVNQRFKYTHGYGVTLTTVSEFTPEGLPNLLVKDIPPQAAYAALEVARPEIYYGELTDSHVIVDTEEEEFDYPSGEQNVYAHYSGDGGVRIHNLWRRFLFGWIFDGTRLLFSSYPTRESQILYHRQIQDRVRTVAPFLTFDDDPYVVLANGQLYWIVDAYTTSEDYPYSEPFASGISAQYDPTRELFLRPFRLRGINYIRNSVKVVVDAFDGSVDLYVFDPDDPLIQVWQRTFPDLFKDRSEMPRELVSHIRYPVDMLVTQGLIYAKYHMTEPDVFYNQEDLWMRATEKYYGEVQPVEPYYIMWEPTATDDLEFILMLPFTPKNRQVLIGWIAGMCDGDNYGRLLAYKFPKEKRVLGTQQMETKIDQDSYLSGQLSLWDQRGSRVIRGNVLAIPVEETLVYVEPIYLQAETAAYPELRLVAVMHSDNLSYAPTFEEALTGLFGEAAPQPIGPATRAGASVQELAQRASQAFDDYLEALGRKDFEAAASQLARLQETLSQLTEAAAPTAAADTSGTR
ncbi:MAG: UPF0182 family protein [Gemmatimonadetes bacterium]|uniref:UPF0182 protein GWO12_12265 n=1 Tax=Candidatus Kutchimonas denitrificans TaxID=3056748 RepID=A0AAE4ZAX3_9BACT|nr:UPF0182 family protein [Gemmatimonadota bacterium]NIR75867.1 UPF0182 family protein [Candidatus Kutchimonas denitrificans]NIS02034.1 UPF0182 family protein [Gemmatimonadota bacterium]NIT67838.1 UPF0182 family protein [Gemmatimonadota bacterium]NIU53824.1 UPF0182 family protein [Gemmatimonadota bacterium]